jgi:hypothetical protein
VQIEPGASTGPAPTSKTHGGFFYRTALKPIFRSAAISVIGPRGNRPHVIWAMTNECMPMTEEQIDAAIEKAKAEGAPAKARFILLGGCRRSHSGRRAGRH